MIQERRKGNHISFAYHSEQSTSPEGMDLVWGCIGYLYMPRKLFWAMLFWQQKKMRGCKYSQPDLDSHVFLKVFPQQSA